MTLHIKNVRLKKEKVLKVKSEVLKNLTMLSVQNLEREKEKDDFLNP